MIGGGEGYEKSYYWHVFREMVTGNGDDELTC